MIDTVACFTLAAIMSGTLNLIMYFPWVIVAVVVVSLALGLFLPYHVPVIQCLDGSFRYTCP